jgi:N-acetyl-gamma-glutamyl-phosphate reductase
MPLRAGIVGGSGYGGVETLTLLLRRDDVTVEIVSGASTAGKRLDSLYPALAGRTALVVRAFNPDDFSGLDVVFVSLPSGEGMKVVPELAGRVDRIIDLGGDFRLHSTGEYEKYYKHVHTAPHLLGQAVYGLPELNRNAIAAGSIIANPGCYPTSAILALLPALTGGIIHTDGIVITSLSGTSGAGRSASVEMSFSEVNESVRAYKIGNHQHIPEIEQVLSGAAGRKVTASFIPHLLPITRGIFTTVHTQLDRPVSQQEVESLFRDYYRHAPFVRIVSGSPQIAGVTYSNYCDIGVFVQERTGQLVIMSAIDNLVKGAAGQAIQNMNLMFGLPETLGLHR